MSAPDPKNVVAVILAGGASTRMGRDKATLEIAGERLVDRVAAVLREALRQAGEDPRIVVSGRVDGFECVTDRHPGSGPVEGLRSVFESQPDAVWLLAVPVDLPALTVEALAPLLAQARAGTRAAAYDGHALPVLLRVEAGVGEALEQVAAADGRNRSLRRLLEQLDAVRVPPRASDEAALANANSPEELDRALAGARR